MITNEQTYPSEPLDHKRADFEAKVRQVAVERFGYTAGDALLKSLNERNRNGRYTVEWVRGAWEGVNMNLESAVADDEPTCQTCGGDRYIAVPRTPGIDCPACTKR